jgi:anti-sigma regulatory factor (Ser/Thr protein kinase)
MTHLPEATLAELFVADHCHLRIPSLPDWVEPTAEFLVQRAQQSGVVTSTRAHRLMTALHEGLSNAIIHGNLGISSELKERDDESFVREVAQRCSDPVLSARVVDIRVSFQGRTACWVITDEGAGFDHAGVLRRLDEGDYDPTKPSGRGLMLMRAFVDEIRYERDGRRLLLFLHPGEGAEKRTVERVPMARNVRVAPIDERGQVHWLNGHEALMRNVSAEGIGLLQVKERMNDRVLITIPTEGEPVAVPAEVRHWREISADIVEVGCRFHRPINLTALGLPTQEQEKESAVARLIRRLSDRQTPGERRQAQRVVYHQPIQVESHQGPMVRGFARDLSRTGISFYTSKAIPLDLATLQLPMGDDSVARVPAHVVRCRQLLEGFYEVAAMFGESRPR